MLEGISGLSSAGQDQFVLDHERRLHVEVLDVHGFLEEPSPLMVWHVGDSSVVSHADLELVLLEIDLCEDGDGLIVVSEIHLLGHDVEVWKDTSLGPLVRLEVKKVVSLRLIASHEQELLDALVDALRGDTWTKQLFGWARDMRHNSEWLVWSRFHNDTPGHKDSFFKRENDELIPSQLMDVVGQDFLIVSELKLLKSEEKSWPVLSDVLAIMAPLILFKVDFSGRVVWLKNHTVDFLIFDVKMLVFLDDWVELSVSHDLRNNLVVEMMIEEVPLEKLFDRQEVTDLHEAVLGFDEFL